MNRKTTEENDNYTFELVFQEDTLSVNKSSKDNKILVKDNIFTSSIITTSGCIGIGVLYMWTQLFLSGLFLGIIQIFLTAIITYLSCLALILSSQKVKKSTYTGIAESTLGKYKIIIDILFFLSNFGCTIGLKYQMNLILIEGLQFFNSYFKLGLPGILIDSNTFFWVFVVNLILFGFFFLKSIEPLKIFNFIGIFSILLIILTVISIYFNSSLINFEIPSFDLKKINLFNYSNCLKTIPFFIGSFCVHPFILDIYYGIRPNTMNNFKKTLKMSLTKITIIYLLCSIFGYISFYDKPEPFDDILKKYRKNNILLVIPNFCFFISLFGTSIIMNKTLKDQISPIYNKYIKNKNTIVYSVGTIISFIQTATILIILIYQVEPSFILNILFLVTSTPISLVFPFVFFVISHKNQAGGLFRTKFIKIHTLLIIFGSIIYALLLIHVLF